MWKCKHKRSNNNSDDANNETYAGLYTAFLRDM